MTGMADLSFPAAEFDDWADSYDTSVLINRFPFYGYQDVLTKTFIQAQPHPGISVLDLGTGTGNLAHPFARFGCRLWCTDFSEPMLAKARQKVPSAHFFLHDLHNPLPAELDHPFDRIVSAYVFHHFDLDEKIRILVQLLPHLAPAGWIVLGDIAFPDAAALEKVKIEAGREWQDEFYWILSESTPALAKVGFKVDYFQISSCAGVFSLCL
jgi:putative AdoMet-dependent methyltransferase